ncbi:unnamed protein product [Effrenium voratum]|nr:unnamed protein product [Effrenium voratum]
MAMDHSIEAQPLPGCSVTPRAARLLLNDQGQPGIVCEWLHGHGLQVTYCSKEPGQPDFREGDVLSVLGSSSLAEAPSAEEALKHFHDECFAAFTASKRGIGCVVAPAPKMEVPPVRSVGPGQACGRSQLYKVWPAGNRFFCRGYCMTGSPGHECSVSNCIRETCATDGGCCLRVADVAEDCDSVNRPFCTILGPANCFAWVCIMIPCSLYFTLALPYYWSEVHPLLPLVALFFFLLTVGCLLAACLSDPGILPRREVILATGVAQKLCEELGYNILGDPVEGWDGEGERITIPPELKSQGYRWCTTCRIVRPPRASHCSDCDNCVMRFDHHCPFINNCVGQRNYLFFFGFTSSVCLLALVVIPSLMWYLLVGTGLGPAEKVESTNYEVSSDSVMRGILITLAAAGGTGALCVLGLWGYHLFLICSGITTREHIKGPRGGNERLCPSGPHSWFRLAMAKAHDHGPPTKLGGIVFSFSAARAG